MAALTIRNVDEGIKQALRLRAAEHGVSMEEEARRILREALLRTPPVQPLGQRLRQRFAEVAQRTRSGRPISTEDAQIASIARLHGLTLATRNGADFDGINGLAVVHPWHGES